MTEADALKDWNDRGPHKIMTPEEYAAMPIKGWHEVCRDVDGFGGVGVRFLGECAVSSQDRAQGDQK